MTKPIGPICNLECRYCFYLEKVNLFAIDERFRMSDAVLEEYVRSYIEAQPGPEVSFAWQGGEPTLLGIDFFRRAVELQKIHGRGRKIENAFQTNGTLLNDEWAAFFKENDFLVGVSIDGPAHLHDHYRVTRKQGPSYKKVIAGIEVLKKHGVEFNTLTCVHAGNVDHPVAVYKFLRDIGSTFLQFIPIVERLPDASSEAAGLWLAHPPSPDDPDAPRTPPMQPYSVPPEKYGDFLCKIFDKWVRHHVGKTYVQLFDVALGKWLGIPGGLCYFSETCGRAMAIEHDGNVYPCDHYVYPRYRLANVLETGLGAIADDPRMQAFGEAKRNTLPEMCVKCRYRFACNGECPKHRFCYTPDGEYGLNYLCPAYKKFFRHIDKPMRIMADLYRRKLPPAEIMKILAGSGKR